MNIYPYKWIQGQNWDKPEKKPIEKGQTSKFNYNIAAYMKNIIFWICQCAA